MNAAESEIAAAVANIRGQQATRRYGVADQPAPRRDRTLAPDQNAEAKRFHPPADRPDPHVSPFGPRPGFAGTRRPRSEAVIALGRNPALWGGAIALFTLMIMRAAAHLGVQSGPVIVHLVWPV